MSRLTIAALSLCAWFTANAANGDLLRGGGDSVHRVARRHVAKRTEAPFDIDPDTWISDVESIPTDVLTLFYSPTCPDCEKLMPQWARIVAVFEDREDLTLLTVADPEGVAPGRYKHLEIPAIFFSPKEDKEDPYMFSESLLHAFIDTPETQATQSAIRAAITSFALDNLPGPDGKRGGYTGQAANGTHAAPLTKEQESMLTAKLLVALKNRAGLSLDEQLQFVRSPPFAHLPVAQALSGYPKAEVAEPLATIAARLLDAEPEARREAEHYAKWYMKTTGLESEASEQYQQKRDEVIEQALPNYMRKIYQAQLRAQR